MVALCQKNFDSQPPTEPCLGEWTRLARWSSRSGSRAFHITPVRRLGSANTLALHIARVTRPITPARVSMTRMPPGPTSQGTKKRRKPCRLAQPIVE